jgi:UDP-N-acetylmuramoyl-tripeptide--D-alanyl-D-alanine ligase
MSLLITELTTSALTIIAAVLLTSAGVFYGCAANGDRCLHVMQLNSYQIDGYKRSLKRSAKYDSTPLLVRFFAAILLCEAAAMLIMLHSPLLLALAIVLPPVIFAVLAKRLSVTRAGQSRKKPLVFTQRLNRLKRTQVFVFFASSLLCGLAAVALFLAFFGSFPLPLTALVFAVVAYSPFALVYMMTAFAAWLREGPEKRVNQGFIEDAKHILGNRPDLIRVGITGSYGKTSAKFILGTLLAGRYSVLVPPSSYNTPMGVARMVREMLLPEHEVIIAEMGARHVGEIAELCDIVRPNRSLLTSIGNQHLETFGSFLNIVNTKYEIMQALGPDGIGFFPNDGGTCLSLFEKHTGKKVLFGLQKSGNDVWAEAIELNAEGSSFTLCTPTKTLRCTTRLLGEHNILNILGCAAVALSLGLTLEEIANGIMKVEPVEHRLQLINPGNGVLVIDDAFNSNPQGTAMAMDVLSMFAGFRKICVTPGMVELGDREFEENRLFGERMAKVCDIVILVGPDRAKPMAEGLESAGFSRDMLHVVADLNAATVLLGALTRPGDVILFENDLPDHYVS